MILGPPKNAKNFQNSRPKNAKNHAISLLQMQRYPQSNAKQESKTCKNMEKGFQSLKANQKQVLHLENSQILAPKFIPR
jgi:hypothetical protein